MFLEPLRCCCRHSLALCAWFRQTTPPAAAGPILLEDYQLVEKLAGFDRERIPERVVHARGASAKGFFEARPRGRPGGGRAGKGAGCGSREPLLLPLMLGCWPWQRPGGGCGMWRTASHVSPVLTPPPFLSPHPAPPRRSPTTSAT